MIKSGRKITKLADTPNAEDEIWRSYVDAEAQGLKAWKQNFQDDLKLIGRTRNPTYFEKKVEEYMTKNEEVSFFSAKTTSSAYGNFFNDPGLIEKNILYKKWSHTADGQKNMSRHFEWPTETQSGYFGPRGTF